eukprot:4922407-Pleurochrysis_carterae.AAC.1
MGYPDIEALHIAFAEDVTESVERSSPVLDISVSALKALRRIEKYLKENVRGMEKTASRIRASRKDFLNEMYQKLVKCLPALKLPFKERFVKDPTATCAA